MDESTYNDNEFINMFNELDNSNKIPVDFLRDNLQWTMSSRKLLKMDTLGVL